MKNWQDETLAKNEAEICNKYCINYPNVIRCYSSSLEVEWTTKVYRINLEYIDGGISNVHLHKFFALSISGWNLQFQPEMDMIMRFNL